MTQLTHTTLDPATVRADQGEARWWFDALAVIKVTGAETGGAMTIVEMTYPRDADTPLHVHHREDEAFWILEGSATFLVGRPSRPARATTCSGRATSPTSSPSDPKAAGCCSFARPEATSRTSSAA